MEVVHTQNGAHADELQLRTLRVWLSDSEWRATKSTAALAGITLSDMVAGLMRDHISAPK
jgi:hypothetical protein